MRIRTIFENVIYKSIQLLLWVLYGIYLPSFISLFSNVDTFTRPYFIRLLSSDFEIKEK